MNRFLFCILSVTLSFSCFSQEKDPKIDSLKNLINTQEEDSIKVNALIELATIYTYFDVPAALKHGTQAKQLAETVKYSKGIGYAYNALGNAYASQANYPEADIQFKAGLAIFEEINFKEGIANILSNLGTIYNDVGDATKSLDYHLQSLKVAEEIDHKKRIGTSLLNIGTVYAKKDPVGNKGLEYFTKSLKIFNEIGDLRGAAISTANLGEIYFNKGMYDSSLVFFESFVKMAEGSPEESYGLNFIGEIFAEKGDYTKAFENHNQSVEIAEALGVKWFLIKSLLSKAKTLRKQGKIKNSIDTYRNALIIAEEIKARPEIKVAYESLTEAYASLGDFKNAYTYGALLTSIKDTLYNTDEDKKIQQLQFNFDIDKKENEINLLTKDKELQQATIQRQRIMNWAAGITGFLLLIMVAGIFNRYKYIKRTNKIIQKERDRSKELLLNILPEETAHELETQGNAQTRFYESVTVLFTDFKGFSTIAGKLSPQELVAELNDYFIAFDEIVEKYDLEKIKTIGDAYMCAGGIPVVNDTHALNAVQAALEMQEYMQRKIEERQSNGQQGWELRIGIHTGPIVAGVVGKKKYAYDIWGDTVNIASRMESNGAPGKVNISSATYNLIKVHYECLHRGKISAKNIGEVDMYFVEHELEPATLPAS